MLNRSTKAAGSLDHIRGGPRLEARLTEKSRARRGSAVARDYATRMRRSDNKGLTEPTYQRRTPRARMPYLGAGCEQTSLIHKTPSPAPQQSLACVHLSPSAAHPVDVDVQTRPASPPGAQ